MHSSVVLRVSDTRCVSPQTISSSGYHSDLSSTNDSPRSTHDHPLGYVGSYPSMRARKKADESKRTGLTQISDFIRKQYARAKSKFVCEKPQLRTVETCAKSTSTTTMPFLRDSQYQRRSIMVDRQPSAFVEPVSPPAISSARHRTVPLILAGSICIRVPVTGEHTEAMLVEQLQFYLRQLLSTAAALLSFSTEIQQKLCGLFRLPSSDDVLRYERADHAAMPVDLLAELLRSQISE